MKYVDLTRQSWRLLGWRPFSWQIGKSMEIGLVVPNDIPAIPAQVPGSVQNALRKAGWIADWNTGLNSLQCEWAENRHWEYTTEIPSDTVPSGEPVILCADGLDHSGWILIDEKKIGGFHGSLRRHRIDLSPWLSDGKAHRLGIIFDLVPREQGQVGFTVETKHFKPRFNYSWDFCPRMVPVGIWDRIGLEIGRSEVKIIRAFSELNPDLQSGKAGVIAESETDGIAASLSIFYGNSEIASNSFTLVKGKNILPLAIQNIKTWWTNGEGEQNLYTLKFAIPGQGVEEYRVGFKQIRWTPCSRSPKDALPWICEINGKPLFLQGVNWVPIRLDYHSVTEEEYRQRIDLYREMGCNILRVWGGAFLEKKVFYDLCDEAGLMVWQEFPLSSSGIDNWPPEDPGVIFELCLIAKDYIHRRAHHASLLLWCAGNELQHAEGSKTGVGIPVDLSHPCIAALAKVVAEEDPGTRFLPASSSGPQFCASEENYGKGMHHDIHGPWNTDNLEKWTTYWNGDDSLLRSETGMPGAASVELMEKYSGECNLWPPDRTNPYFLHANAWWIQWDQFRDSLKGLEGREGLKKYVDLSQELQARALTVAVQRCRDRFPECSGILLWMGHDVFPCPINTSIIDFDGTPKPAYFAIQKIFRSKITLCDTPSDSSR